MRIKTETIKNLKLEKSRSGKIIWPFTKALMALVLVVTGLVLLSHIVKIIDDGSGQGAPGEVKKSSTGKRDFALILLLLFINIPGFPERHYKPTKVQI